MTLKPPDYIDERAVTEFNKVVDLMGARAQPSDVYVIAEFAQCISDIVKLLEVVAVEGSKVSSDVGAQKLNPNLVLLMNTRLRLSALTKDLGLTPKQRKTTGGAPRSGRSLKDNLTETDNVL